jgi:hypothetical protein
MPPIAVLRRGAVVCLPVALSILAASASSQAAAGQAGAAPARQCFFASTVRGFAAVDDQTVNIRVGVNDIDRLDLFAPCPDITFATGVALRSTGGGDSVCYPTDAELVVPSPIGPQRCMLRGIRKLTPAEVAALPPKAKP